MDRREFLIGLGIALVAGPAAISLSGCGKSSSSETPAAPADSFIVASSVDLGHSHNITFPLADLANPPSGGKTYHSDGSHIHDITLTQQQLTDINNGLTVGPVTSTFSGSPTHTHTWTIKKP
jgi:hypothetical protein